MMHNYLEMYSIYNASIYLVFLNVPVLEEFSEYNTKPFPAIVQF